MKFINQSLYNKVVSLIEASNFFKVANTQDDKFLHKILESVGMSFSNKTQVLYSRRPNLWESYYQSSHTPIIFLSKKCHGFMCAVSETKVIKSSSEISSYYLSDLRSLRKTDVAVRKEFKELFPKVVAELKGFCYTVIFNNNQIALRSLASKKNTVCYNKLTEYTARTFFVLPGFNFTKFTIEKVGEHNKSLYNDFNKSFSFEIEHKNINEDHFIVRKKTKIVGSFSTSKPKNKNLLIETKSLWVRSILKLNGIFNENPSELSWRYISHLRVRREFYDSNFLPGFIKALRKSKAVKNAELVVMLYSPKTEFYPKNSIVSGCPQLVNNASIFQVELTSTDRTLRGEILLDPNQL